jgi:putative SOS response-associated peptidase YedK
MCANYEPVTRADRMLGFFGVHPHGPSTPPEVWPLGLAPIIHLEREGQEGGVPAWQCENGLFGLLPHFATEVAYGRRTYNARSETVHKLPSFRDAWKAGQRRIIPAEAIYEPCWETGRAVRWRISLPGGVPMGIAGIYRPWRGPDGQVTLTFAMLTVNADKHPVMSRFHRPTDEKRMVVILKEDDHERWLTCAVDQAAQFFRQWAGELVTLAAPLPVRRRSAVVRPAPPAAAADDSTGGAGE